MKVQLEAIHRVDDVSYSVTVKEEVTAMSKVFMFQVRPGDITVVISPDDLFEYFEQNSGATAQLSAAVLAFYCARSVNTEI